MEGDKGKNNFVLLSSLFTEHVIIMIIIITRKCNYIIIIFENIIILCDTLPTL